MPDSLKVPLSSASSTTDDDTFRAAILCKIAQLFKNCWSRHSNKRARLSSAIMMK
jgi:hypothetical protein